MLIHRMHRQVSRNQRRDVIHSAAQGASAYKAKVSFPEGEDVLERSVIVGEMNPAVNLEQVCLAKDVPTVPSKHMFACILRVRWCLNYPQN